MKDLAISPLRYWYRHINPERPEDEPTPQQQFGSAVHCAVLEPGEFSKRYACKVQAEDYDGCLVVAEDLKGWLRDKGIQPKGTTKAGWISQIQSADPTVPIFDVIRQQHAEENAGKVLFGSDDWARIRRAADSLLDEPRVVGILTEGQAEVSIIDIKAPDLGVPLKGRLDFVAPAMTLDIKTFSQTRGKSIDKTITDAIWYEGYYQQAYFYTWLRVLSGGFERKPWPTFVFAFVESEEPHEVRLRALRPVTAGQPNLYWERARREVNALIQRYADYRGRYGDQPWRDTQEIDPLIDEEVPQLVWA